MIPPLTRRALLQIGALGAAAIALRAPPAAGRRKDPDRDRLTAWSEALRAEGAGWHDAPIGRGAARVGELAAGTPYQPGMLDAYLATGRPPMNPEPLTLSLTRFDCVTLVESCLAVARVARHEGRPAWKQFGSEIELMRYREGERRGYASRLHYFSEWISNGERRGLVRDVGADLGAVEDPRPLRFMTGNRGKYPALADDGVFREIAAMERRLDRHPRRVVPTERIAEVSDQIETGDVLAFATAIPGLDVSHAAFAYRGSDGILRVLHAPLSGGVVEVTRATLPEYVATIRRATGILVARPCRG